MGDGFGPAELDAMRRQMQSDAIEAGARHSVDRLVAVAAEQLAAGMLPAQVMGDLLASFTTAQAGDDELDPRAAAAGVEVIAAGAVVMLAQNKIDRSRR